MKWLCVSLCIPDVHMSFVFARGYIFVIFLQHSQTHCAASEDNGQMATDGDNRGGLMGSDKLLD